MQYWKTRSFLELQREWYERLADTGFTDIETLYGTEMELRKLTTSGKVLRALIAQAPAQAAGDYYRELTRLVQTATFHTEIDAYILTRHADGARICQIVAELAELGTSRTRGTVRFTIRHYEMAWGLRKYTQKQLGNWRT